MKKLFLSYSGVLDSITHGYVSHADLASGIYMFQCVRAHAIAPRDRSEYMRREWKRRGIASAHAILRPNLLKAEKEGRVCWLRKDNGDYRPVREEFNHILARCNLPLIKFGPYEAIPVHIPTTELIILRNNIPLEIIS